MHHQDIARHKPYLNAFYNACACINKFGDTLMDNCNIATSSIEPIKSRSSPCTTITISPLIQSAVRIVIFTRNAVTASKPNVVRVTTILKW